MAMAEVYRPESDDRLSPFPRAPPPSPEAQHRTLGGVLELPGSIFDEGFGIDLRRRDFDFSENEEEYAPSPLPHVIDKLSTVRRSSPKRAASSDTDDSDCEQPGSPMKRMCNEPSTMPNSFELHGFQQSSLTSRSTGYGLLQSVSTDKIKVAIPNFSELAAFNLHSPQHVCSQSHSQSTSPTLQQQHQNQSSPCSIPPRCSGSVTPTHQPTTQSHDSSHLLSKSFDLHNVHSHFPAHFEVTPPPPEVRPTRSRTLDTSMYGQESPVIRMRKVSLKRNFGELETEPNLQFSFDYSYSSTGSSGESDWVVIENDMSSSYPQGKKACCQQEPLSSAAAAAMSKRHGNNSKANSGSSPVHATNVSNLIAYNSTTSAAVRNSNSLNQENMFLQSCDAATATVTANTHLLGQSSSPLGVSTSSNAGADLSSFPGGSAASNGSGSHSPLHTQLRMIHEGIGPGSSAELHNATSASAGYNHDQIPTANAAVAERSHRTDFVPQWSMEMMDCGDYSTRLDSIDSMDCGQTSDPVVTMHSLGGLPDGQYGTDLDDPLLFSNCYGQQLLFQQQHNHLTNYPEGALNPSQPHLAQPDRIVRSQSSPRAGASSSSSHTTTRHSFIENYFNCYHYNQSALPGVVGEWGQTEGRLGVETVNGETRLNFSKSL